MDYQKDIDEFNNKVGKTNDFLKDAISFLQKLQEYKEDVNDENFSKQITNSLIEAMNKLYN